METIEEFIARGGKIKQLDITDKAYDISKACCKCGCRGVVSEHDQKRERNKYLKKPFEEYKNDSNN